MTDPDTLPPKRTPPSPPPARSGVRRMVLGAALLAACGLGAGATAIAQRSHQPVLLALAPAPVSAMQDGSQIAVRGQVSEIFGNKFILADDSGRALIDTGRKGEDGTLVARSDTVTVQGRFEHGFVHALAIQYGDGRTVVLGPPAPPPPPHGPLS